MKRKVLALVIPALLTAGAAHAAEIYNKDGNIAAGRHSVINFVNWLRVFLI